MQKIWGEHGGGGSLKQNKRNFVLDLNYETKESIKLSIIFAL